MARRPLPPQSESRQPVRAVVLVCALALVEKMPAACALVAVPRRPRIAAPFLVDDPNGIGPPLINFADVVLLSRYWWSPLPLPRALARARWDT